MITSYKTFRELLKQKTGIISSVQMATQSMFSCHLLFLKMLLVNQLVNGKLL